VQDALRGMREEAAAARRDLDKLAASNIVFNQIATSGKDLRELQEQRDVLAVQFGEKPENVADLIADARQLGFEDLVDDILAARQVVPPSSAAAAVGQVPQIFQGQISGLESLNAILKGSETSSLTFEDVAEAIPKAAEGAAPAGSSPAEVIALASVFSAFFARSDTMSDRLKAFGSRVAIDPELKGKGIVGGFQALQAMPDDERRDWLGMNQELNAVYNLLSDNIGKVAETQKEVQAAIEATGTPQGMLEQGIERARGDKDFAAQLLLDRAEVAREVARRQRLGVGAAESEAAVLGVPAQFDRLGRSPLDKHAAQAAAQAARFVQATPEAIEISGAIAPALLRSLFGIFNPAQEIMQENIRRMDSTVNQIGGPLPKTEEVTPPQKPDKLFPKDERIKQAAEQGGLLNIASEDKSDLRVMVNPRFELPDADKHREVLNAPMRTEPPQPNFTERRFVPDRMHAVPVVDDGDDIPATRNPFAPRPIEPKAAESEHGRELAQAAKSLERAAAMLASAAQGGGRQQMRTPHKPSSRAAQLQERNAQRE